VRGAGSYPAQVRSSSPQRAGPRLPKRWPQMKWERQSPGGRQSRKRTPCFGGWGERLPVGGCSSRAGVQWPPGSGAWERRRRAGKASISGVHSLTGARRECRGRSRVSGIPQGRCRARDFPGHRDPLSWRRSKGTARRFAPIGNSAAVRASPDAPWGYYDGTLSCASGIWVTD